MSKPVKELMIRELTRRFDGVSSVAVVGFTGLDANVTHSIRGRLQEKDINLQVVKNSLARKAFETVGLDSAVGLLDGPCAIAFGSDNIVSVVRELLDIHKEQPNLIVKGAVLEGDVFSGDDDVKRLSKFPTRDEAISELVGCVLSAGANLSGCLIGPAGQIAGILKTIEEKNEGDDSADAA